MNFVISEIYLDRNKKEHENVFILSGTNGVLFDLWVYSCVEQSISKRILHFLTIN
jgi:hypothetical protein